MKADSASGQAREERAVRGTGHGPGVRLVTLALLAVAACRRQPAPPPAAGGPWLDPAVLEGQRAYEHVQKFVALGPRPAGSEKAMAAAGYLVTQLVDAGVADSNVEVSEFSDLTPDGERKFRNVLARIPGTGSNIVIVASHYDTKTGIADSFAGANDGGSSTGLLLALAEVLSRAPRPAATILLAFLDGEECLKSYGPHDGLHGSRRLARDLRTNGEAPRVQAFVLLDMIGDRDLTVTIPRNCASALASLALQAAHAEGARQEFRLHASAVLDDHVPFLEAGMPAVDLIDFEYGSEPGKNDYWHTPEDTLDKLSPESLQTVGRVVVRMLNALER